MKMMRFVHLVGVAGLIVVPSAIWATEKNNDQPTEQEQAQHSATAEPGKWENAGREVRDAAGAVVEATRESTGTAWDAVKSGSSEAWDKTKSGSQELYHSMEERSKEAWHATREESQDLWHKGKALIHEATAPEPVAPAPSPPPAAPPASQ